jgi:hypothetical protein
MWRYEDWPHNGPNGLCASTSTSLILSNGEALVFMVSVPYIVGDVGVLFVAGVD